MTQPDVARHAPRLRALPSALAAPQLVLSSSRVGWEDLVVEVFHEPRGMESWQVPARPAITLGVYLGGAMHVERRQGPGSWQGGTMQPGDMVLNWGHGAAYEVRFWSLSSLPTQELTLHLNRELLGRVAEEVAGVELARLEVGGRAGFRDPLLSEIALALWRELEQPTPAGKLYAQTAAQMLAVHLVQHYSASRPRLTAAHPSPPGLSERQLRQVREFIQTHLREDLSLDTLAQHVSFSPYHFVRLFRRTLGVTPHQFVVRQRLEHARRLLRDTEMPLAQVAQACGFADQSHLTQVFRQQVGCTPHAYRQQW